jgi:hypothetical protein
MGVSAECNGLSGARSRTVRAERSDDCQVDFKKEPEIVTGSFIGYIEPSGKEGNRIEEGGVSD